jgi:hypothetical protein
VLICETINFTGTVKVNGGAGAGGKQSGGGGGGGGGGVVIMAARTYKYFKFFFGEDAGRRERP